MIWLIKFCIKIFISKIPFLSKFIHFLGLFKLGNMQSYNYAVKIFNIHFREFKKIDYAEYGAMLELGPGLSILSALLGYSAGFKKYI